MDVSSRQLVLRNAGQCLKAKNNTHFARANPACYALLTWVSGRGLGGGVLKEENMPAALLLSCLYTSALGVTLQEWLNTNQRLPPFFSLM